MSKKIFPREWKETHPHKNSDPSDSYYAKIANRVLVALESTQFEEILDKNMIRCVALALTSWFEDVMSDLGIWRAFTSECKRRYGSYLPFYDTSEDNYFPDEINLEDVRFLLWHYVQQDNIGKRLLNPENIELRITAETVYHIFDQEYEDAPINHTLQNFFTNLDVSAKSFYPLRSVMEWFCYDCYLNIYNEEKLFDKTMDFFKEQDIHERDAKFVSMMSYNIRVDHLSSARNILALTSYQWLAMIENDPAKKELLRNICYKQHVGIYVDSADDEYVYAREIGSNGELLKITIESFDPKNIKLYLDGKAALTSLLYFDGAWWISGTMIQIDASELENSIAEDKETSEMIKASYDLFIEKTEGKRVLFFKNTNEYEKFAHNTLGFRGDKANFFPTEVEGDDMFVCANPNSGIYTQFNICSCFKHPDNPLYDKEDAEGYAHVMLLDAEIPYCVATLMIDEGLLADAQMVSTQGKKHGHKLMQDNIYFLNDYFRERCRDIDYI
ncbi:MAG: DUF3843 family protein [Rikenellaceae bacterium]